MQIQRETWESEIDNFIDTHEVKSSWTYVGTGTVRKYGHRIFFSRNGENHIVFLTRGIDESIDEYKDSIDNSVKTFIDADWKYNRKEVIALVEIAGMEQLVNASTEYLRALIPLDSIVHVECKNYAKNKLLFRVKGVAE